MRILKQDDIFDKKLFNFFYLTRICDYTLLIAFIFFKLYTDVASQVNRLDCVYGKQTRPVWFSHLISHT